MERGLRVHGFAGCHRHLSLFSRLRCLRRYLGMASSASSSVGGRKRRVRMMHHKVGSHKEMIVLRNFDKFDGYVYQMSRVCQIDGNCTFNHIK